MVDRFAARDLFVQLAVLVSVIFNAVTAHNIISKWIKGNWYHPKEERMIRGGETCIFLFLFCIREAQGAPPILTIV